MRERVRLLGGTLEISDANPGTVVSIALPVQSAERGEENTEGGTLANVS
jgi:signal transduction histidine kinase